MKKYEFYTLLRKLRYGMLEVGTKAPDFELLDQDGNMHKLSDYIGKKVI